MIDSRYIKDLAAQAGFDMCGIARSRHLADNEAAFRRWLAHGYDSSLGYLRANLDKRFDTGRLVEGARSVVVCAVGYKSAVSDGYPADWTTKVASYACNRDYHKSVKKMLLTMLRALRERYPELEGRAFVDSAPLLENIFFKNSPLHDGAVVIANGRIAAAKCVLPSTEREVPMEFGMRHRAALGASEVTDALVVVVSEERGTISVARKGHISRNITPAHLRVLLRKGLSV